MAKSQQGETAPLSRKTYLGCRRVSKKTLLSKTVAWMKLTTISIVDRAIGKSTLHHCAKAHLAQTSPLPL